MIEKISKEEIKYFFKRSTISCEENMWICQLCPESKKKIKQKIGTGFTNLRTHIINVHPNWQACKSVQSKLNHFIRPKSSHLYGWLKKVILNCQPISIVENPIELEFTTLKPICRKTLKEAIVNTSEEVKSIISKIIPSKFCICFDAWTENKIHFIGIYAIFNDLNNTPQNVLLAFTTLVDESNWTAQNYADTISNVLESFNKSVLNVVCLIGDNCNTNKRLATLLKPPLVGWTSHKLNLAVENYLEDFPVIKIINQLMIKISTPLKLAKLRTLTSLKPITRNSTRWSSCFQMIDRFFTIKDYLDIVDTDIAELMPNQIQIIQLQNLMNELRLLNELTIYLQKSHINLADVRKCFDKVTLKHQKMKKFLDVNAPIVHSPKFDTAVIKVLNENEETLDDEEREFISSLIQNPNNRSVSTEFSTNPFIVSSTRNLKTSEYMNLNFIPATSNMVERLFSLSRRMYSDHRKSLNNTTLENIIFLNQNNKFWNEETVDKSI